MSHCYKCYDYLMKMGRASGCHQRADRSFHIGKWQFPVCARCTGVFIGEFASLLLFHRYEISIAMSTLFCIVMFSDWFVQYKFRIESNNFRRLITGLLCGYAFGNILLKTLRQIHCLALQI